MLRNRAKRKYGTVAQEIQFSGFYRTAIIIRVRARKKLLFMVGQKQGVSPISKNTNTMRSLYQLKATCRVRVAVSLIGVAPQGAATRGEDHMFSISSSSRSMMLAARQSAVWMIMTRG